MKVAGVIMVVVVLLPKTHKPTALKGQSACGEALR